LGKSWTRIATSRAAGFLLGIGIAGAAAAQGAPERFPEGSLKLSENLPQTVVDPVAGQTSVSGGVAAAPPTAESVGAELSPEGEAGWADPVSPKPSSPADEGFRSEVERSWFKAGTTGSERATAVKVMALSLGIANVDSAARALIQSGDAIPIEEMVLATEIAPDLPIVHMALAKAMWVEGERLGSIRVAAAGVAAIFRNLEAMTWWIGSLLVMISIVLIVAPFLFMLSVGLSVYARVAHDMGDLISKDVPAFARAAMPALLLLIPLALGEGIIGVVLVLFGLGFVYGTSRHRVALGLAAVFFMIGIYPMTHIAGSVLMVLDSDPVASASLAVIQGIESQADLEILDQSSGGSYLADYILATRDRQRGLHAEALERYEALHKSYPREAGILTNLGNLRFRVGDIDQAVGLYERSAALGDSARVMFNLSQANARLFRIEEFEIAMTAAQAIDAQQVAELSRIGNADFVADMPFPMEVLNARLLKAAQDSGAAHFETHILMPGWLGQGWLNTLLGFASMALLGGIVSTKFDQASVCTSCGQRICGRCDGTMWNSETCDACYHLFHRPETTDPVLRKARLAYLQKRDVWRGRFAVVVSALIPGVGGLLAKRPNLSFAGTLLCGMAIVAMFWHRGVVPDPLALGSAGAISFMVAGSLAMLGYVGVVAAGLMIRRNL
jgi:hypothetical protein